MSDGSFKQNSIRVERWADQYGQGNLVVQQYTDDSVRGQLYIDDGKTQSGKLLGDWYGIR
jgi:hypothetical protein